MWVIDERLGLGEDEADVMVSDIAGRGMSYKALHLLCVDFKGTRHIARTLFL